MINHRPLFKVLINPFLRPFGICIASKIDYFDCSVSYTLIKCERKTLWYGIKNIRYKLPKKSLRS